METEYDLINMLDNYITDSETNANEDFLLSTSTESKYYESETLTDVLTPHMTKYNNINILHLNIQSLPAKFDKLNHFIAHMDTKGICFDAILLCETFLHQYNSDLYNINGYNLVYKNRTNMIRGGVAIYIRDSISFKIRDDISTFVEGEFESLFIEATIMKMKIIIGEIYRTPGSNANTSVEHFETILNRLKNEKHVIIGTDQNFDLLKIDNHAQTSELFNNFVSNSFIPAITKPTRITSTSATLIDNIYVNNIRHNTTLKSGILLEDFSDHLPIFCTLEFQKNFTKRYEPKIIERRQLTEMAVQEIKMKLSGTDWNYLLDLDVGDIYHSFINKLNIILDETAPVKKITLKPKHIMREPWMTKGLSISSRKVPRLFKKTIGKERTHHAFEQYIRYRNLYNQLKRIAKQSHYGQILEEYKIILKWSGKH